MAKHRPVRKVHPDHRRHALTTLRRIITIQNVGFRGNRGGPPIRSQSGPGGTGNVPPNGVLTKAHRGRGRLWSCPFTADLFLPIVEVRHADKSAANRMSSRHHVVWHGFRCTIHRWPASVSCGADIPERHFQHDQFADHHHHELQWVVDQSHVLVRWSCVRSGHQRHRVPVDVDREAPTRQDAEPASDSAEPQDAPD